MGGEQIEMIGILGQLGLSGVILFAVYVIWMKSQKWVEDQQDRDDERWAEVRLRDEELMKQMIQSATIQSQTNLQTAKILQEATTELKVIATQLNCKKAGD